MNYVKNSGWGWGWGHDDYDPDFIGELYHHVDQLGSTIHMSDEHGVKHLGIRYDAYGQIIGVTIPEVEYGYNGKPFDVNTQLYNYGFRDYSASEVPDPPQTDWFQTIDPIEDGSNWYNYVSSTMDPVNSIDFLGLDAEDNNQTGFNLSFSGFAGHGVMNPLSFISGKALGLMSDSFSGSYANDTNEMSIGLFPFYSDQFLSHAIAGTNHNYANNTSTSFITLCIRAYRVFLRSNFANW